MTLKPIKSQKPFARIGKRLFSFRIRPLKILPEIFCIIQNAPQMHCRNEKNGVCDPRFFVSDQTLFTSAVMPSDADRSRSESLLCHAKAAGKHKLCILKI